MPSSAPSAPHLLYRWRPEQSDNPYLGYLALADRIIVTSDSMSMLAEAMATESRSSSAIWHVAWGSMRPGVPADVMAQRRLVDRLQRVRWQPWIYRLGQKIGPLRMMRDLGRLHRSHVASGRAVWLGQPWPDRAPPPPLHDAEAAADRVRQLFEDDAR